MSRTLSIIIPCFNEEATLRELLERVERVELQGFKKEIILIDDGSNDKSPEVAKKFKDVKILSHDKNQGKGSSIKSGLAVASGEYVLIQDADLEYAPEDYPLLLGPVFEHEALAVYGVRQFNFPMWKAYLNFYYWGARFLNQLINILYSSELRDIHVGHKLFKRSLIPSENLKENGFSFCHELTCLLLEAGVVPYQVPITYVPRSIAEGKKIRAKDGVKAICYVLNRRLRTFLWYNKLS